MPVFFDNLSRLSPMQYAGIIVGVIFIFLAFIGFIIWRRFSNSRGNQAQGNLPLYDVEKMRKEGLITEEEYKVIKRKVAERVLAESRQQRASDEERLILEQAQYNPEVLKELIPAELREKQKASAATPLAATPAATKPGPQPSQPSSAPQKPPQPQPESLGDPLGGIAPAPKSELDLLFEKGALSREQYEKLKGLVK